MTPTDLPTPPGEPFAPEPLDPAGFAGCRRPVVIGCLGLLLLVAAASLLFVWKAEDLLAWTLTRFEQELGARLPEELSDAERERLARGFEAGRRAIRDGTIDPEALATLQRTVMRLSRGEGRLTREEVDELATALEALGGAGAGRDSPMARSGPIAASGLLSA